MQTNLGADIPKFVLPNSKGDCQMDTSIIPQKQCTKCKQWFDATTEYFNKNCQAKDGLHPNCKGCRRKYREDNSEHIYLQKKAWRENNPEKEKKRIMNWIENNREHYLNTRHNYYLENKEHHLSLSHKRYYDKRDVILEQMRQHYADNKDEIRVRETKRINSSPELMQGARDRAKKWREDNPVRFKAQMKKHLAVRRKREYEAEGHFTIDDLITLYENQNGVCAYCGKAISMKRSNDTHLDHIRPISRGGSNWPDNLAFTCRKCNTSKGNKTVEEWKAVRGW